MRTRSFKILRLFTGTAAIIMILSTLLFWSYCLYNIRFLRVEAEVFKEFIISFQLVCKTGGFLNILLGCLTCYFLNITSKAAMLVDMYLDAIFLLVQMYFMYVVHYELRNKFANILNCEFYSRAQLSIKVHTWRPDLESIQLKDAAKRMMGAMADMFVIYDIVCMSCSLLIFMLLYATRHIELEKTDPIDNPPEIAESSKVGLDSISLRAKRVVRS